MKGIVYKITGGDEVYVGSTMRKYLCDRKTKHKTDYIRFLDKGGRKCQSVYLFQTYGYENCKMELLKEYEVVDRKHLNSYETLWIRKLNAINKQIPHHLPQILKNDKGKLYRQGYLLKYRKDNLPRITDRVRKNRQNNRDKYYEKFMCPCGSPYTYLGKTHHFKSKKHQDFLTIFQ